MKPQITLIAGLAMTAVSFGAVSAADESEASACLAPMSAYSAGMPTVEGAEGLTPEKRIVETTMAFKEVMDAAERSHTCFQGAIDDGATGDELAALQAGVVETNRIFANVQSQFSDALDMMSGDVLSDVAPAAGEGAEADLEAEATTVAGMELLFDSYMALERSQEISKRLSRTAAK
ncbi:hypothetical protein [Kordiimonas sp.]|uniref:hypothetical protein n=1 Tax=Kordiimonas sp. TaxID=1970157 RepID=UPI003A94BBA3